MAGRIHKSPEWASRAELLSRPLPPAATRLLAGSDTREGYLHWSEFRRKEAPEGWTIEDLWVRVLWSRRLAARRLDALRQKNGQPFLLTPSDPMSAALHRIDTKEVLWKKLRQGDLAGPSADASYALMAAIEEAHHSSAIEGAVTTRRQSRELIRSKREPRDVYERMVLNNYRVIRDLGEWSQEPLTPERIREIQAAITEGTLAPSEEGRFRDPADEVFVYDSATNEVVFRPPEAAELPERMERLCAFANAEPEDEVFLHPVTRAILLHHQLAYDHPFADGNGRTGRAVFLWSLLRSGYSWFRLLSISRAVHEARAAYYRSFRYVQEDEGDVTYFVRQQLVAIEREIDRLASFLERRARLGQWLGERRRVAAGLKPRQIALMEYALDHPGEPFTAREHAQYHGVSQPTSWKDLTDLVRRGLLTESRQGRRSLYWPSEKLRRLAAERPPEVLKDR